jgi:predicted N-acetyltransferase YhbS
MQIIPLADCPQHVDTVTQWLWDEWGGAYAAQTQEQVRKTLLGRPTNPPTLVALERAEPVGVLGFRRIMFKGREPLLLFINSLFVAETQRGHGVGSALLRAALARVGPQDAVVYVYTHIRAWYEARGFALIEEEAETGNVVLRISLNPAKVC